MSKNTRIAIVGSGNAGSFFVKVFAESSVEVEVFGRKPNETTQALSQLIEGPGKFDLILLCVSDGAIAEVSSMIKPSGTVIAHCSGAMHLDTIDTKHKHRAVLYPLMSLSEPERLVIKDIPFCLEADREKDLQLLSQLVKAWGAPWFGVGSEDRLRLHLAAVIVQNFTNHLFHLAQDNLNQAELDFRILMPLILSTVEKLQHKPAFDLQTGPALRHDEETIQKHLQLIDRPLTADIYKLLTQSIQQAHDQKL